MGVFANPSYAWRRGQRMAVRERTVKFVMYTSFQRALMVAKMCLDEGIWLKARSSFGNSLVEQIAPSQIPFQCIRARRMS